jgi:hypothetical protein
VRAKAMGGDSKLAMQGLARSAAYKERLLRVPKSLPTLESAESLRI